MYIKNRLSHRIPHTHTPPRKSAREEIVKSTTDKSFVSTNNYLPADEATHPPRQIRACVYACVQACSFLVTGKMWMVSPYKRGIAAWSRAPGDYPPITAIRIRILGILSGA